MTDEEGNCLSFVYLILRDSKHYTYLLSRKYIMVVAIIL